MKKTAVVTTCGALTLLVALLLGCGPRYFSEPPPEFYDYVDSVPTPTESALLAENLSRWTSPQEVCTGFALTRLYGTNRDYDELVAVYEQDLKSTREKVARRQTLTMPNFIVFFVSDVATVNLAKSDATDPVALLHFDEETMRQGQSMYTTLFVLDLEHRYGDCDPSPFWPTQWSESD